MVLELDLIIAYFLLDTLYWFDYLFIALMAHEQDASSTIRSSRIDVVGDLIYRKGPLYIHSSNNLGYYSWYPIY